MIDETDYKAIQKRVGVDAPLDHLGLAEQFAVRHWRECTVDVLIGHDKDGNEEYAPPCPAYAYDKLRGCWREFRTGVGWKQSETIMSAMSDLIDEVCKLEAKRLTQDKDKTEEQEREKVRTLRQRWMSQTTMNAALALAAELLGVEKWDASDTLLGLPHGFPRDLLRRQRHDAANTE